MKPGLRRLLDLPAPNGVRWEASAGDAQWLRDGDWRIYARPVRDSAGNGSELARFTLESGQTASVTQDAATGEVTLPFDPHEAYLHYLSEAWRERSYGGALSARQLDLFYRVKRFIPRRMQLAARRRLIRRQALPEFPRWPIDDSVLRLTLLYLRCVLLAADTEALEFRWFWPAGYRSAAILTHDVETREGLRLAVELADLEEARGLRSSFNVVTDWYPIDHGVLRELRRRGFEIGIHGVHHDRSMFSSRASFDAQQPAVRAARQAFSADGFRSPATHRVFEWLADLPVAYDCTIPHSDPYEPQPGGCCSLWPFFIGDVVELPYTLPQDHTLLTLLNARSAQPWIDQLDGLHRRFGLAQALTHPDPGYLGDAAKREIYAALLDALSARTDVWTPLPRTLADWWRVRDAGVPDARWPFAQGTALLDDSRAGVALLPPTPVE